MAKIKHRFIGEVFDDREPDKVIYTAYCFTDDDAYERCRNYINTMFKDPDDGVVPSHIDYRVKEIKRSV